MSYRGILRRAGVNITGPDGSNDWNFEGVVNARNVLTRLAGSHFHVDSNHTNASDGSGYGKRKDKPYATINYAAAQCAANNADVIWAHAGHVEAIVAVGGLGFNIEGITVTFLGNGDGQAKITFSTDVDADMDIDADNITLVNPRFESAIDALTGPIDVNKANFTIINGEYYDAAAKAATDCIVADENAIGLTINGWKYFESTTGTQKQSNIQLDGVDDLTLRNIDIRGDFGTGNIEDGTDELLNLRFEDIYLDNLHAATSCMVLDSNCDGYARDVGCRITTGTNYVSDVADINWGPNCRGFSVDGGSGEPIGTVLPGGLEGKIDVIDEYHDVPAQNNVLNAQINEVLGNKTDTGSAGAVTETDTLVGYVKQLVTDAIAATAALVVIDEFHDVPAANNILNAQINEVIGNKSDTTAAGAVTATDTLVAYIKQLVAGGITRDTALGVVDGLHDVPIADAATNLYMRDVVGIKTDAAAAGVVSEVESLMAYLKQAITLAIARDTAIGVVDGLHDVPTKDAATDLYIRDVVGIKTDTAAAGAVSEVESIMAYVKQAVTEGIARDGVIGALNTAAAAGAVTDADLMMAYIKQLVTAAIDDAAQTLKLDGVTIATAPVAASLASFIASGGTALGTQLPASFSLLDMTVGKKVSRTAADVFDGTQTPLFTISGGRVCIKCLMGEVSVAAIDAGASNTSFVTNPTVGTDAAMCAVLDINADENGTIYAVTGNPSVALQGGSGGGASCMDRCFIVAEGTIDLLSVADVGTGGALGAFEIWYVPIDTGATLVVA